MIADAPSDILCRVLEGEGAVLTPDRARYVLTLKFRAEDLDRIGALAERSNDGLLTPEERTELEAYNRVRMLLIRLKSRARQTLAASQLAVATA